ncbi:MAG: SH3 domain-containing protein, partial [Anaerolineae bacterium]|nr:SH3 domain-containing protein [Anaerolineae bacterium]
MQGDVTGAITNIITGIIAGAVIILALAGCSGSGESDEPDQPAESSPPIRSTTVSIPTDAPALIPPLPTATQTPLSSITPVSASPAATTAITTVSTTSAAIPTETAVIAPTSVLVIQPTITPTPLPPSSPTAIAAARPIAQVCGTCDNLRLRETPGSAGRVMAELTANTPLTIIGRTQDNAWLQVVLNNGTVGWVASQYVESDLDLAVFRVVDQDITDAAVPAAPGAAG